MRNPLPGDRAGPSGQGVAIGVNQHKAVVPAEIIPGRIQRSRDGDSFPRIETLIRIHHQADELNEKISDRWGGLPDAVSGRRTHSGRHHRRRYQRHLARISFDYAPIRGEGRESLDRCGVRCRNRTGRCQSKLPRASQRCVVWAGAPIPDRTAPKTINATTNFDFIFLQSPRLI